MRALPMSPSQSSSFGLHQSIPSLKPSSGSPRSVKAYSKANEEKGNKQSLFGSITEALDFSQVRSEKDAELLYEAKESIKAEGKMTREQYGALRRKIGGTYKDFFKSYVDAKECNDRPNWFRMQLKGNTWRKVGWTRPAKFARRTQGGRPGRLTN